MDDAKIRGRKISLDTNMDSAELKQPALGQSPLFRVRLSEKKQKFRCLRSELN